MIMRKEIAYLILIIMIFTACEKVTSTRFYSGIIDKELNLNGDTTISSHYSSCLELQTMPSRQMNKVEVTINDSKTTLDLIEETGKYYKYGACTRQTHSSVSSGTSTSIQSNEQTVFLHKTQDSIYYTQKIEEIEGLHFPIFTKTTISFKGIKTN